MANEPVVFDAWTPISFKRALGARTQAGASWVAPTWVGNHSRRLQAYKVLQAYVDNAARHFMAVTDAEKIEQHREYGDAALLRDQILAALLGDDQTIVVPGADDFDPEADETAEESSDNPETDPEARRAYELQEWARQWATDERFGLKKLESERNSVGLGDGVLSLGWDPKKGRVRLRVWDPGFYFPVLNDDNEDDFPETVHIAWELEKEPDSTKVLIRRITWRLVDRGDEVDATTYNHPWNDEPTTVTCLMTDAVWEIDQAKQTVQDLSEGRATYAIYTDPDTGIEGPWRDIDLGIDFIPVIHEPNTVAVVNHFGRSSIATVLQILDDLSNSDTDLQAASATTGKPMIALSGSRMGSSKPTYGAGEIWELGENGELGIVDTSKSLEALMKYVEFLLRRLSTNSRVPESVLGRLDPSKIASGVLLALSFGPLETMVKEMRLVRDEKDPLIFKFSHRMSAAYGVEGVPEVYDLPVLLEMGSFLPDDVAATVTAVKELLAAKAISLETGVIMLINAGLPIEDAAEEVRKIQENDFEGAMALFDATGSTAEVAKYLGRDNITPDGPAVPPTPPIPVPPVLPEPITE